MAQSQGVSPKHTCMWAILNGLHGLFMCVVIITEKCHARERVRRGMGGAEGEKEGWKACIDTQYPCMRLSKYKFKLKINVSWGGVTSLIDFEKRPWQMAKIAVGVKTWQEPRLKIPRNFKEKKKKKCTIFPKSNYKNLEYNLIQNILSYICYIIILYIILF